MGYELLVLGLRRIIFLSAGRNRWNFPS